MPMLREKLWNEMLKIMKWPVSGEIAEKNWIESVSVWNVRKWNEMLVICCFWLQLDGWMD